MQTLAPDSCRGRRLRRWLTAGALLFLLDPDEGRAQAPDEPASERALDVTACTPRTRDRLEWLVDRTESREFHGDLWWRGWIGFYSAGAIVQGVRAGFEDDGGKRADYIVSSVKAVGGVTRLYFARPVARLGADPLLAEPIPDEEACLARVAQGEALLAKAAEESQERWDWKAHAFNVGVNLAGALIVTQAFDQKSGWTSMGIGIAVGEAMIWSHPWQGKSDLAEYEERFAHTTGPRTTWALMPYAHGLRVQVRF